MPPADNSACGIWIAEFLVGPPGIEPGTYGLGNRRSVQLSYNPLVFGGLQRWRAQNGAYYIKNPRVLHKEQTIFDIIFQMAKKLIILGVTGSIGRNAVDIVLSHPDEFSVTAVAALRSKDACEDLARRLGAKAYVGEDAAVRGRNFLRHKQGSACC